MLPTPYPTFNSQYSPSADLAISTITLTFRAFLKEQSIDHLATALRKGGVRDLLAFFPPNRRSDKVLDEHFRNAGLPQVAEWWTKRQYAALKEGIISTLKEMLGNEDAYDDVRNFAWVSWLPRAS